MSYILDALRRAQAERERGQVPSLHAQPGLDVGTRARAAAARSRPRPAGLWALGAAALVAALLVPVFWLTRGDGGPPAATASSRPAAPALSGGPAPAAPAVPAALGLPADGPPLVVVSARPENKPAVSAAPVLPTALSPAAELPAAAPPPLARPGNAPAAAAVSASPPMAQQPSSPVAAALPSSPPAAAVAGADAPPAVALVPPVAPRLTPPAAPAAPALPPLLTADQLREWPPLSLGGSVWSETPSARFVILGGQVVREGDSTPDGVQVERITPKAVVVRWRDMRGALPL